MEQSPTAAGPDRMLTDWFARPAFWEACVWLVLCVAWIGLMAAGDSNGIGYFQQPGNGLVLPLAIGGIVNAATFWSNAFYAIPRYLKNRAWLQYALALLALFTANVVLQTVAQVAIIHTVETSLRHLSLSELLVENCYLPPFVLVFSALYRFARDWIAHGVERERLVTRATELERSLREATMASAGAFLFVGTANSKLQIPMASIKYVKAAGNYNEIVTTEGTHLAYGALKTLADNLPPGRFVRVHRSYIAGLDHVSMIKDGYVRIGEESLPIGAAYKKALALRWNERSESMTQR